MARFAPGSSLGPYAIVAPLGAGGMGEVYRARDPRLGRDVAIKLLPRDVAANPDRLARFEREAKTVAALNHPNIVTIHSIEEADGVRFLTMELLEGDTLDRAAAAQPGIPRALDWAIALADALSAAHDRGIVHRDLKPANVMVTRDGRLKVLDFGLAKHEAGGDGDDLRTVGATMAAPLSTPGVAMGTVPYMAPEQIRGEAVDARADLFSFGILLYELVTGRRPFAGKTWADVSSAILRDAPPPIFSIQNDLPRDLERIVLRCLDKDRDRRFQTARDVRNELELVRRELALGTSSAAPAAAVAPSRETPSVAVLPFANRSASADDEYFSDGLADELLNVLAKIRGLRVAARTSSSTFKGKSLPIAEVGQALGVASVLEGSVRKSGNRVRIAVQLVNVADGFPLWSETYDRTLDDVFAVQDDIAQAVVKELRQRLLGEAPDSDASREVKAEVAAAGRGRSSNPEALRLYLQGRHMLDRLTEGDIANGLALVHKAIELDPGFALAWVAVAIGSIYRGGWGWAPVVEAYETARKAVDHALALELDLPEALVARGRIEAYFDRDFPRARASINRALALAPGSPDALLASGALALFEGRIEESIRQLEHMFEIDPLSTIAYGFYGFALRSAGRLVESEAAYRRRLELNPHGVSGRAMLALVLTEQGRLDEAMLEAARESTDWSRLTAVVAIHHAAGRHAESAAALAELERDHATDSSWQIAVLHAFRGETDAAFEWLHRAIATRDSGLTYALAEPYVSALQTDSRWEAFLRKLHPQRT